MEAPGSCNFTWRRHLTAIVLVAIAIVEAELRRTVWLAEIGARRLEAAIPIWRKARAILARRLSPEPDLRLADEAEALIGG